METNKIVTCNWKLVQGYWHDKMLNRGWNSVNTFPFDHFGPLEKNFVEGSTRRKNRRQVGRKKS
jgi:hypothetical protein